MFCANKIWIFKIVGLQNFGHLVRAFGPHLDYLVCGDALGAKSFRGPSPVSI